MTTSTSPPSSSADRGGPAPAGPPRTGPARPASGTPARPAPAPGLTWRPAPPGRAGQDLPGPGQGWPPVLVAEDLLAHGVVAAFSSRVGGSGRPPFDQLNLGLHVGDEVRTVLANRRRVATVLGLAGLAWATVRQVHSADAVAVTGDLLGQGPPEAKPALAQADALVTAESGLVLAALAADCVPVLLADPAGRAAAAVHAGWRGLAAGVVEAAVAGFVRAGGDPAGRAVALVGPAVGPCCYEVGPEVEDAVAARYPAAAATSRAGRPSLDLAAGAVQALRRSGFAQVRTAGECTVDHPERFFSYRRDRVTGRQAGLVALVGPGPGAR
jgi:YfiH family protein